MREEIDYAEALQRFKDDPHITITPWDRSVNHLRVTITGRAGTQYDNMQILFEITMPPNYPLEPPYVFCHTHVFHPKIIDLIQEGPNNVCLPLIAPAYIQVPDTVPQEERWTPSKTLADVVVALDAMFSLKSPPHPPKDPPFEAKKLWFE